MSVKFLADANLTAKIINGVCHREPAIDFLLASKAGLHGKPDIEVLAIAAGAERLLVTHDKTTMPLIFARFLANAKSPGVILVPAKLPIRLAIEDLLLVWSASEEGEWTNRIIYLPL